MVEKADLKNLGTPVDIEFLMTPDAAGPMFSTCTSNTSLRAKATNEEEPSDSKLQVDMDNLGEPIDLESLNESNSFMGLQPKENPQEMGGVPLFTGTIIMLYSIYFMVGAFFEDGPLDTDMVAVPSTFFI